MQSSRSCSPTRCWKPQLFASFCQKMVGPAAKRETVAHLQAVMGLSERRVCFFVVPIARWSTTSPAVRRRPNCAADYGTSPMSVGALAIGDCSPCRGGKASHTASIAYTGKKSRRFASAGRGGERWAHERQSWSRRDRTHAGRWTSCTTSSPGGGAFACSILSMT